MKSSSEYEVQVTDEFEVEVDQEGMSRQKKCFAHVNSQLISKFTPSKTKPRRLRNNRQWK